MENITSGDTIQGAPNSRYVCVYDHDFTFPGSRRIYLLLLRCRETSIHSSTFWGLSVQARAGFLPRQLLDGMRRMHYASF
jgi:hypothetical protein